jgi:hypothetical protein
MIEKFLSEFITLTVQNWQNAWANKAFRKSLFFALSVLIPAAAFTSFFFSYIEDSKGGIQLNDWVLKAIPATDVSIPIIIIMTSAVFMGTIRSATNPNMFITLIWAYAFQLCFRIVTISATRFIAPPDLIILKDPFGSLLYPSRFITRDLFYSGHTAFLFQLYLCSTKIKDRYYFLLSTIALGSLLLVQHVHYTIDVITAPLFALACFWLAKKVILFKNAYTELV